MTQPAFGQVAPISRRAVAYLIDALIAGGLGIVLGGGLLLAASLTGSLEGMLATLLVGGPIVSLILIAWFFVYTMMQSKNGSIGMRAQGLRLESAGDGGPLGFGRTLLRNIIFGLAASIVVGYFTPLFDGSGRFQGWHDKVAKSLMVDARTSGATRAVPPPPSMQTTTPPPSHPAPIPGIPAPTSSAAAPTFAPPAAPRLAPPSPPAPVGAPAPASPAPPPSAPAAAPRPVVPAAAVADPGTLIAYVPGVTQDAPPRRAEPVPPAPVAPAVVPQTPPAPPAPTPSSAMEPDDSELEDTRISIPGHRLVFTWDDGTRVSVSRRTIFGRNPAPEEGATVVPVRDETLSLSKTHFEAAAETSGGWVLDRHSTNGMTIVREGQRIACPPGQRVPVRLGDAIEIGDRIVTVGGYA
ncbi:MAG TPA: RDD family protein [Microbacterium sp.]|nr:RDD family protein [Microbacterium sp.]